MGLILFGRDGYRYFLSFLRLPPFPSPPLELTEHIACQIANVMELMQRIVRAACKLIIAG